MTAIISKKELNELMKIEGEIRGMAVKGYGSFILKEKGEEGLKKLEDALAELGCPIKYREIRIMDFYPLNWYITICVTIQKLFNFDGKKFEEMGWISSEASKINKLFLKHFFPIEKVPEYLPKVWRRHFTFGDPKVTTFDREKRIMIIRIENLNVHPLWCQSLKGAFSVTIGAIVGNPVTCEEIKCVYRGDEYHEFLLRW